MKYLSPIAIITLVLVGIFIAESNNKLTATLLTSIFSIPALITITENIKRSIEEE